MIFQRSITLIAIALLTLAGCQSGTEEAAAPQEGAADAASPPNAKENPGQTPESPKGDPTSDNTHAQAQNTPPAVQLDGAALLTEAAPHLPGDSMGALVLGLDTVGTGTLDVAVSVLGSHFDADKQAALKADLAQLFEKRVGANLMNAKSAVISAGQGWFAVLIAGELGDLTSLEAQTVGGLEARTLRNGKGYLLPTDAPQGALFVMDKGQLEAFAKARTAGTLDKAPGFARLQKGMQDAGTGMLIAAVDLQTPMLSALISQELGGLLTDRMSESAAAEDFAAFLEETTAIAEKNTECAAQARAIQAHITTHQKRLDAITAAISEDSIKDDPDIGKKVMKALEPLMKSTMSCKESSDALMKVFKKIGDGQSSGPPPKIEGLDVAVLRVNTAGARIAVHGSPETLGKMNAALQSALDEMNAEIEKAQQDIDSMPLGEATGMTLAKHLVPAANKALVPKLEGGTLTLEAPLMGGTTFVALTGVFSAIAIPAFLKYIRDSKTAEAEENLKSLGDGASMYFMSEHASPDGLSVTTGVYPLAKDWVCSPGAAPMAKTAPTGDTWNASPWKELRFSISRPHYYKYCYKSGADGKTFAVRAEAALDNPTPDSFWCMKGRSDNGMPLIGVALEQSGPGECEP